MFSFTIEGITMHVEVSDHAWKRMKQRKVDKFAAYGSIVALGETLLDMHNNDEFCIMDKELDIAVCCAMHMSGLDITIDIVTVLDSHMFFVKDGVQVYQLGSKEDNNNA